VSIRSKPGAAVRCAIALWIAVLLAGCNVVLPSGDQLTVPLPLSQPMPDTASPDASLSDATAETEAPETTAEPPREPVSIPLLPLEEGDALAAREIFALVSPAIAYIDTPGGTGSAVLAAPGYLVTNAHVVWPYSSVRVVFPDGSEFTNVAVLGWDLLADIAVLEAPETTIEPLPFVDASTISIGSDVYLIGYPGEVEDFPQPALVKGLHSRLRRWDGIGLRLLQADADVSGGQSGGVMVSDRGEVIGITTFYFTEARYALASSAADLVPRMEALLNGDTEEINTRRPLLSETGAQEQTAQLEDSRDTRIYYLQAEEGTELDLRITGPGRPYFYIYGAGGSTFEYSENRPGKNTKGAEFTAEDDGPFIVHVGQESENRNRYTLTSNAPLFPATDPDDGATLTLGEPFLAAIDAPGDEDAYEVELTAGQKIVITTDALSGGPSVQISFSSRAREETAYDYDSGIPGIFGNNPRLVYEAKEDGTYRIVVSGFDTAGYTITVSEAGESDTPTELRTEKEFYTTPYGPMEKYESKGYEYSLLRPAGWTSVGCPSNVTACFGNQVLGIFAINEANIAREPIRNKTTAGMMDQMEASLLPSLPDGKLVERKPFTTSQGIVGEVMNMTYLGGLAQFSIFVHVDEEDNFFMFFMISALPSRDAEPDFEFGEYLFSNFYRWEGEPSEDEAFYHLDRAMKSIAERDYDGALAALDEALALDPAMIEAFRLRGVVYEEQGEYELALAAVDAALELRPASLALMERRAEVLARMGNTEEALAVTEAMLELRPDLTRLYNNRALYHAYAGDYEAALAEIDSYIEAENDDLPLPMLDTRAYIYLMMGENESALADYEELLAEDFQNPYTLFGAGIAYARLGETDTALPLLEYGMEKLEDLEIEVVEPQLASLTEMAQGILDAQS
jgi:S1-C subfamily serine protease/tetratricopeptide (TPR) repeat protein